MLCRKCYKHNLVSEAVLVSYYGLNKYAWVKSLFNTRNLEVLLFHLLWVTSSRITYNKYKTWVDVFSFWSNSPISCHMPTICSASVTISWLFFPVYSGSAFLPLLVTQNIVCNLPFICISLSSVPVNDPTSYYTGLDWSGKEKEQAQTFGQFLAAPYQFHGPS